MSLLVDTSVWSLAFRRDTESVAAEVKALPPPPPPKLPQSTQLERIRGRLPFDFKGCQVFALGSALAGLGGALVRTLGKLVELRFAFGVLAREVTANALDPVCHRDGRADVGVQVREIAIGESQISRELQDGVILDHRVVLVAIDLDPLPLESDRRAFRRAFAFLLDGSNRGFIPCYYLCLCLWGRYCNVTHIVTCGFFFAFPIMMTEKVSENRFDIYLTMLTYWCIMLFQS